MNSDHETPPANRAPSWPVCVALLLLIGFCVYFFSITLPNNPEYSRRELLELLPVNLLENIDPTPTQDAPASGWHNLPQRFDLMLVAGIVLSGAWGIGHLLLRILRIPFERSQVERTVFAFGLGLSALSLTTLAFGMAGLLERALLGGLIALAVVTEVTLRVVTYRRRQISEKNQAPPHLVRPTAPKDKTRRGDREFVSYKTAKIGVVVLAITPFLLAMFLGSMLPSVEFDVKEYHLQGPKEFYEAGQISMLPHNVYTSFPFLTEMLSLLGMVLRDDWYWGALAGKAVLMSFAPLTALALYAAGRRWFSPTVGCLAAMIHLTTPWTYRISIIAYAEGGLTFFLAAALLATALGIEQLSRASESRRHFLLAGLLAGSAMACKYPGIVQVVLPIGFAVCVAPYLLQLPVGKRHSTALRSAGVFAIGTAVTIGPWLLKNTVETGNPVYPLAYSVFGGIDWDDDLNARWQKAHRPDTYAISDLAEKFIDVTTKSDWLNPLLFGLAPLALLVRHNRRATVSLWLYVGFLFFAWWILTHRIDRFWIPLIPLVSLLAAVGTTWTANGFWRYCVGFIATIAVLFNLAFITTSLCGLNLYLADLTHVRRSAESTETGIQFLNEMNVPAEPKVLCVGAAQVFDAQFPVVYNTVFDDSIFEQWCGVDDGATSSATKEMRPPAEIREILRANGVTHIYVNWQEILRYRPTYGYTDFVAPARFTWLQRHDILGDDLTRPDARNRPWSSLSERDQHEVAQWAPELRTLHAGQEGFITMQIFPVIAR